MNKKPVSYLQTDSRWKNKPYKVTGETSTIGSAGCGPTSAAMLISTITGKTFTPLDAANWSMAHGYKALNQGTYYTYFKAQFADHGIDCDILNYISTYGKPTHENHKKAIDLLQKGYYLIALMNAGLWTSSGHFVVVWWADSKIHILDPNSTKVERLNGDPTTFKSQVKYYWWVDARTYNGEEELDMTKAEFLKGLTDEEAYTLLTKALNHSDKVKEPDWSKKEGWWSKAIKMGVITSDTPESLIKRDEIMSILGRLGLIK